MRERCLRFLTSTAGQILLVAVLGPPVIWLLATTLGPVSDGRLNVVRAIIAGLAVVLLVFAPVVLRRVSAARRWLLLVLGVMTLTASVVTVDANLRRHLGTPRQVSSWNFFHYYLGGKYFAELGYDGLYKEALKADELGERRFSEARSYRDMKTYDMKPARAVRQAPRLESWTDERWEEFQRDVATIGGFESRRFWTGPLRDRGYNPPPGWLLLGGTLTKLVDPSVAWQSAILMWVDPALLLLAFLFSIKTYGPWRSALVLLAMAVWIGTHRLLGGKVVQYEWLAACWAALCCLQRGHFGWAGALMAIATSVRVFPGALMLGPAAFAVFYVVRERRWPAHFTKLFGVGAVTLAGLILLGGLASGRGLASWGEFAEKSAAHNNDHKFNESRVGLPYVTTASLATGISDEVAREVRERNYEDHRLLRHACQALLIGLLLLAVRRGELHDAAILSVVLVFALAVSSRYYASLYALLLLRGVPGIGGGRAPPTGADWPWRALDLAFFCLLLVGYWPVLTGEDNRTVYMTSNFMLLAYLVATLAHQAFTRYGTTRRPDLAI